VSLSVADGVGARALPPMLFVRERACRGVSTEIFYQEGRSASALAVCGECPIRRACLDWALETEQKFGVWGGTTPKQRRRMGLVATHRKIKGREMADVEAVRA
jgi:WhiB family redox-sensing transcriptional regulator